MEVFGTNIFENTQDKVEKKRKLCLTFYEKDFYDFVKFRNYKVVNEKNIKYTFADVWEVGINLLAQNYASEGITFGHKIFKMKRGVKNASKKVFKRSSVDLDPSLYQMTYDVLYHIIYTKQNVDFTIGELIELVVKSLKKEYPQAYEKNN